MDEKKLTKLARNIKDLSFTIGCVSLIRTSTASGGKTTFQRLIFGRNKEGFK